GSSDDKPWWNQREVRQSPNPREQTQVLAIEGSTTTSKDEGPRHKSVLEINADFFAGSDLIANGIARFVNFLFEGNEESGNGDGMANPFAQALEEAIKELKEVDNSTASRDKAKTESNENSAKVNNNSPAKSYKPNYLFVGNFLESQIPIPIIASQAEANAFDLTGLGKQYFDLNILHRNLYAQESIAFGDLNNDGIPDLVVTNRITNGAHILFGAGNNRYLELNAIWGGLGPTAATISDFNNDGSMDIAVAYLMDKRVIIDGKRLRKFIFFPTSGLNEEPYSILPSDFNNDGMNDLVVMNYRNFSTSIYLNQGDATFVLSHTESFGFVPFHEVKTDLNNDSIEDTIYLHYLNNHVSVVMQDGRNGSLKSLGNLIINPSFYLVLGDFNLDGVV
ncbi:MAG: FG-GAP repeat domain-containing protein, partial [Nitrososphaera sp.]